MECSKKCPLKSSEQCLSGKCEFWITEVIEARSEQSEQALSEWEDITKAANIEEASGQIIYYNGERYEV